MKDYFSYKVTEDGKIFNKHGKQLKTYDNGRGYQILQLRVDGKSFTKAVHRVVAEAFLERPLEDSEVNHKDGDKLNNHVSNLEWVSRGDNIKHAYDFELRGCKGSLNANAKVSEEQVHEICKELCKGLSVRAVSEDLGVSRYIVSKIKSKKNWVFISDQYF